FAIENVPKMVLLCDLLHFGPGVSDRYELPARILSTNPFRKFFKEVLFETIRLKSRAGLACDYEQRLFENYLVLYRFDLRWDGRIENMEIRLAERKRKHLRAERRAAPSEQ